MKAGNVQRCFEFLHVAGKEPPGPAVLRAGSEWDRAGRCGITAVMAQHCVSRSVPVELLEVCAVCISDSFGHIFKQNKKLLIPQGEKKPAFLYLEPP